MAYTTINKSSNFFNTKLYTGNGSTRSITGVGFTQDFTWIKSRSTAQAHYAFDTVRGAATQIYPASASSQDAGQTNGLSAFTSDGFNLGTEVGVNGNGATFASWNWKAGTAVSGNTSGSGTDKTYTGSVNATAGFSIIKYVGNGTAGHTIPHHLGIAPKMIMAKSLSANEDWMVGHTSVGFNKFMILNSTATDASGTQWNSTTPTNSVFSIGSNNNMNQNGNNFIAYCFAEKQGYSKFGTYTGNNNADGTFVYTGFKPAWVMVFAYTAGNENWMLVDNKRDGYNVENEQLFPNTSDDEESNNEVDLVSNGFKLRRANTRMNGAIPYIYMAFGQSLVGSNNTPCTAR
jgi:hypothetical protein